MFVTQVIEEELKVWEVIANDIMCLPPSKKREGILGFHLYRVMQNKKVAGGNVANLVLIPAINILESIQGDGLKNWMEDIPLSGCP